MREIVITAKVSTVNQEQGTARIYREDTETVSDELIILKRGDTWTPKVGDYVAVLFFPVGTSGIILGNA